MTRIKTLLALLTAFLLGLLLGIDYMGSLIYSVEVFRTEPEWVSQAYRTAHWTMAAIVVSVVGWIALDVRERGIDAERLREALEE